MLRMMENFMGETTYLEGLRVSRSESASLGLPSHRPAAWRHGVEKMLIAPGSCSNMYILLFT